MKARGVPDLGEEERYQQEPAPDHTQAGPPVQSVTFLVDSDKSVSKKRNDDSIIYLLYIRSIY